GRTSRRPERRPMLRPIAEGPCSRGVWTQAGRRFGVYSCAFLHVESPQTKPVESQLLHRGARLAVGEGVVGLWQLVARQAWMPQQFAPGGIRAGVFEELLGGVVVAAQ